MAPAQIKILTIGTIKGWIVPAKQRNGFAQKTMSDPTTTADQATNSVRIEPEEPLLYDIQKAALRLSMSVPSVRKLIRQRRLKRVPDFRKILISDRELRRFSNSLEAQ